MKRANKFIISENGINNGVCENVLFINDGSCRRFITKGDPGWDYYKNDDVLDAITCSLMESSITQFKNGTLMNKKERDTVNKIVKSKNDYNQNKYKQIGKNKNNHRVHVIICNFLTIVL